MRATTTRAHPRRGYIDPDSNIGLTRALLLMADGALHIDEILKRLRLIHGREVARNNLTSRLAKLAKRREVFVQVAPATYDLIKRPEPGRESEVA
jgi:hypothetical protein